MECFGGNAARRLALAILCCMSASCAAVGSKSQLHDEKALAEIDCYLLSDLAVTLDIDLKNVADSIVDSFFTMLFPSVEQVGLLARDTLLAEIQNQGLASIIIASEPLDIRTMRRERVEEWTPLGDTAVGGSRRCQGAVLGVLELKKKQPWSSEANSEFAFRFFRVGGSEPVLVVRHDTKWGNSYFSTPSRDKTVPDAVIGALKKASEVLVANRAR